MGSKSNSLENQFLLLMLNNTDIANVGDVSGIKGSTVVGDLYLRLYTDAIVVDESTIGTECAYTGYVQYGVAVARTAGGWAIVANSVSNAAAVTFGACSAGSETIRYFSIWKTNVDETEANRLWWGQLGSDLAVSTGVTPSFAIGAIVVTED